MNTSYYGGICLTDVLAALNEKHSAFNKGSNGKIYCNITLWVNEETDEYGNSASIQLNPKDVAAKEKKVYIANLKKNKPKETAINDADISDLKTSISESLDDLPF